MEQKKKILIVGNGFGGVYTLRNLHKFFHNCKEKNKIEITLIGEKNYFLFTPLLHEVATGGINPYNITEPIRKVLGCCLDKFYLGKAGAINPKEQTVEVGKNFIPYDYLILASGSETNFYNVKGAEEYSLSLKSIRDAVRIKNHLIEKFERASHEENIEERKRMLTFTVVGGGPTGVELSAEIHELIMESFAGYFSKQLIKESSVILIQKGSELVPQFGPKIRAKSLATLTCKGVRVMLNTEVSEVSSSYVMLNKTEKIETETVIWVAGVKPKELQFTEPVEKSPDGKIIVNKYLQTKDYENIFAIGDVASFKQGENFLPALAQVAEKESLIVAKNIKLLINNKNPEKFTYHSSGTLLSVGRWMAIGELFHITFSGHFAWWVWRTIYLFKLISFRKKVRVATDWTINLFSKRDISEL